MQLGCKVFVLEAISIGVVDIWLVGIPGVVGEVAPSLLTKLWEDMEAWCD
jgi:hypothetical protein